MKLEMAADLKTAFHTFTVTVWIEQFRFANRWRNPLISLKILVKNVIYIKSNFKINTNAYI